MPLDLGTICNTRVARERLWNGSNRDKNAYNRDTPTADLFLQNQAVTWSPELKDLTKCKPMEAYWARICDTTPLGDCSDIACTINYPARITGQNETYDRNFCHTDGFSITDDECKNEITLNSKMVMEMENIFRKFREKANRQVIAALDSNFTAPVMPAGLPSWITVTGGGVIQIPAAYFTHDLMVYLNTIAEYNDINMPHLVSGSVFYHSVKNSAFNQLNQNQKDEAAKFGQMPISWDLRYMDQMFGGTPTMFLADLGGFGFFNSYQHSNTTPESFSSKDGSSVYSIPDMKLRWNDNGTIKQVRYDVFVQENCTIVAGLRKLKWDFEFKFAGGIHFSPADCNGGNGILKIEMIP